MSTTDKHRAERPPAGRTRGVVVFLGNRTGLVRVLESGKQILFRRDDNPHIDRTDGEVKFTVGLDPKNGQPLATGLEPD